MNAIVILPYCNVLIFFKPLMKRYKNNNINKIQIAKETITALIAIITIIIIIIIIIIIMIII